MALSNTTTTAFIGPSDLTVGVASTTGFPAVGTVATANQIMRIDGEDMLVQQVPSAGVVKVMQRGYNGTAAQAHEAGSVVWTSALASDFLAPPTGWTVDRPPNVDDIQTIGVDTTFTAAGTAPTATTLPIPTKNTTYIITKSTAAAIVLISATSAQMGIELTFQNGIAAANTITYTPGFLGDTTSSDVATSAAKVGAVFKIRCGFNGLWGQVNAGTGTTWTVA